MAAQIGLIQAQTEKTKVETANEGADGINTDVKKAGISAIEQGIAKSQEEVTKIQNEVAAIQQDNEIGGRTKAARIKIAEEEAVTAVLTNLIMAEQKDNIRSGTEKNRSEVKLNKAKINQMAEQILQGWEGLKQGDNKIAIEKFRTELEANYKGIGSVAGGSLDRVVDGLFNWMGKDRGWNEVKGIKK